MQGTLQALQTYVSLLVLEEGRVNGAMHSALNLMSFYYKANQRAHHVPLLAFYNDAGAQPLQSCASCMRRAHTAASHLLLAMGMDCPDT